MAINETATASVLTMAGLLASQPFGLPIESIAIGAGFAALGVFGKAAFEIQSSLERQSSVSLKYVLGWVGAGLIGAPFAAVLWLIFLRIVGIPSDNTAIMGLVFLGFLGPKGVTWLMAYVTGLLKDKLGGEGPPKVGDNR